MYLLPLGYYKSDVTGPMVATQLKKIFVILSFVKKNKNIFDPILYEIITFSSAGSGL